METLQPTKDAQALVDLPRRDDYLQRIVPEYAMLFFDHLHSEYVTLRSKITNQDTVTLLDALHDKRDNHTLTWSDIYTFDLALIEERPLENLIRKAYDARAKYRSIAGQKEYDEYLASKPPDLTTILIAPKSDTLAPASPPALEPSNQMAESAEIVQRILRADIRYLLSKFYLYYAMMPIREGMREQLTSRAVRLTKWILGTISVLIILSFSGSVLLNRAFPKHGGFIGVISELLGAFGPIVGSVAFAGIVGGCVSMLQRIQSAPSEGDALFNLAALTNGWRGLSLSPLYGGIFASLLFILFAAGLLQGSAFPKIETSNGAPAEVTQTKKEEKSATGTVPAIFFKTSADDEASDSDTNTAGVVSSDAAKKSNVLKIKDFLKDTGPKDGVSFALLMIWSFIAGFAERLVPDTLNRLVAKNEAIQGTNT